MTHFIDFNDFHSDVLRTTPTDVRADPPRLLALSALGLGGETGEVIDVVKKLLFHRTRPDGPIPSEIREELAQQKLRLTAPCSCTRTPNPRCTGPSARVG